MGGTMLLYDDFMLWFAQPLESFKTGWSKTVCEMQFSSFRQKGS